MLYEFAFPRKPFPKDSSSQLGSSKDLKKGDQERRHKGQGIYMKHQSDSTDRRRTGRETEKQAQANGVSSWTDLDTT